MQDKDKTGLELVAGRKPVRECLEQAPQQVDGVWIQQGLRAKDLSHIMDLCRKAGLRYQHAPQQQMDKIFPGRHQGVIVRIFAPGFVPEEQLFEAAFAARFKVLLALDQVQDPGNVGTIARTLSGLGGAGIIIPKHNAAGLGPGAAKAATGALWRLPLCKVTNLGRTLDAARNAGLSIYGAALEEESIAFHELQPALPAVLVLGGEDKGLREGIRKRCDALLRIPMEGGLGSLNVAQAGALLMGHWLAGALGDE